jgi:Tfp pilus assembly PilM family ATPase
MAQLSIGLDIGHHQVRAIALARPTSAQARAGAVAKVVASAAVPRLDHDGHPKPLPAVLAEIEALLGKRGALTVHLGDASNMVRFVPTLALPPDRRQRLLRLELTQHANEAGDLAADAWEVQVPGEEIVHGCVISQPAHVLTGLQAIRTARLGSARIAYGPAAIANTAYAAHLAEGEELVLVVDIGASITGISLIGDHRLLACRQVPIGGEAFTEALMTPAIDRQAAEKSKVSNEPVPVYSSAAAIAGTTIATAISETALLDSDADLFASPGETFPSTPLISGSEPQRKRVADASFDALFEDAEAPAAENPRLETPKLETFELETFELETFELEPRKPRAVTLPPADDALDEYVVLELDDGPAQAVTTPPLPLTPLPLPSSTPLPGTPTINPERKALGPELQRTAEALYAQLASSVLWFRSQLRLDDLRIARVYLCGGGAALEGLETYLQRRFNCPVALLDPFAQLAPATDKTRLPSDGPAWATAVGLALATPALSGAQAMVLDLRPESLVRADFRRQQQIWPFIAAGLLVLATAVGSWVLYSQDVAREETLSAYSNWKSKREEMLKQLATLDADKNAQAEDLRAIAGRIYAGRDLLFAVRAIKELANEAKQLWIVGFETRGVGTSDSRDDQPQTTTVAAKGYDTAINRGALLLSGRVKFEAASTDTELDQFLKKWRETLVQWKPAPDAPLLFLKQRVVEWDPIHKTVAARPGGKPPASEGEFPFKIEFTFPPTQLDQITATRTGSEKP